MCGARGGAWPGPIGDGCITPGWLPIGDWCSWPAIADLLPVGSMIIPGILQGEGEGAK